MSNDRHQDKRVSDAYKELANERTPEHLDQKILEMAAGATRKPRYSRWLAWSRPVAWAATITLCLAITLELAQDTAMTVSVDSTGPAGSPERQEIKRDNDQNVSKDKVPAQEERALILKKEDVELQQEVAESIAETAASEKTSLARSASKQSFNEPAPVEMTPAAETSNADVELQAPATDAALPAATRARRADASPVSGVTASRYAAADDSRCPAEIRAAANDWLDCILELEAAGLDAAATAERELLIDTFPDFKLP